MMYTSSLSPKNFSDIALIGLGVTLVALLLCGLGCKPKDAPKDEAAEGSSSGTETGAGGDSGTETSGDTGSETGTEGTETGEAADCGDRRFRPRIVPFPHGPQLEDAPHELHLALACCDGDYCVWVDNYSECNFPNDVYYCSWGICNDDGTITCYD